MSRDLKTGVRGVAGSNVKVLADAESPTSTFIMSRVLSFRQFIM